MKQKRQNTHRDGLAETAGQRPAKCRKNKKSDAQRLKEILSHPEAYDYEWKCKKYIALEGLVSLSLLCDLLEYALPRTLVIGRCRKEEIPEWKISIIVRIYEGKELL